MPGGPTSPTGVLERLDRARVATRRGRVACVFAVVAAGVWAFWPLHDAALGEHGSPAPQASSVDAPPSALPPLDVAVFDAPVFTSTVDEVVAAATPPAPPPPPLKLQLLGITQDPAQDAALVATLYDPDSDSVRRAVAGESLGAWRIERITADGVSLKLGTSVQHLAIRSDRPKGGAP